MKHAAILILAATMACRAREGPAGAAASPTAAPAAAAPAPATAPTPSPERLVGRWGRSDSDYTIEIASVAPNGKLDARYLNPGPIHVERAESGMVDGLLRVFLELQDRGYPGSYYTLTYDPGSDSLSGVYHHLGVNQNNDVSFSRITPAP